MADATTHITQSRDTSYATRNNIKFPGSAAQATASAALAITRVNDGLPTGATISGLTVTSNGE